MPGRRRIKAVFYLNVVIVGLLVAYKIYLNFFEQDFESVHRRQVERIQSKLEGRERFTFAVVGNINNSIGIFERKIVPMLNASGADFIISAGNAVSGGGEDKYRALSGTLSRLDMPWLVAFGENEAENFGDRRYYEHFGPFFFSFAAGNSRFIFLDTTGTTDFAWQVHWLREELEASDAEHVFLVMSHPIRHLATNRLLATEEDYLHAPRFQQSVTRLADLHDVDAVFSANLPYFEHQRHRGVDFYVTGGAGGLVLNNEESFYHFLEVSVDGERSRVTLNRLDIGQHRFFKTIESLWFFIHSLFYVGYLNFLLLVSALVLIAIKLYQLVFAERDYYRRFDVDPSGFAGKPLRVAMFTNNYLPYIGGVPISIDRLSRGLRALGNTVLIVAPRYGRAIQSEAGVLRIPEWFIFGEKRELRMANIFLWRIIHEVRRWLPDVIHLHHPVWVGSLGLFIARRMKIPAVFTYHTRLEHYSHFIAIPGPLFRNLISHWLVRRFANKCDAVIVPTYSVEEYLRLIGVTTEVFVQPTGIDFERIRAVAGHDVDRLRERLGIGEEKVLVCLTRLSREKNVDFILDGMRMLKQRTDQPFRLLMLGDGNERPRLEQRVREQGLEDIVTFAGMIPPDEVPAWLGLGHVFVFASKSETQGMVVLEAMAAGMPVVAVRSSGIDDVIKDNVNGFKTPENLERWCEAVRRLLEDDALRDRLASEAVAFAQRFGIRDFATGVHEVYAYCLAARKRRRELKDEPAPAKKP